MLTHCDVNLRSPTWGLKKGVLGLMTTVMPKAMKIRKRKTVYPATGTN